MKNLARDRWRLSFANPRGEEQASDVAPPIQHWGGGFLSYSKESNIQRVLQKYSQICLQIWFRNEDSKNNENMNIQRTPPVHSSLVVIIQSIFLVRPWKLLSSILEKKFSSILQKLFFIILEQMFCLIPKTILLFNHSNFCVLNPV